jgi:UDP-N-acetylglucosamine 2-epimerase (non-hydrolysing)/GDP/UDP-N,N'-diacetylbacillosamine 2-epimerase (hydrolysing)
MEWISRKELETDLGIELRGLIFLVTYHPVTLEGESPLVAFRDLLLAIDMFPDAKIIFTYPNADNGGRIIIECINNWVSERPNRSKAFVSLGQKRYLSLMKIVNVVIGNSSSGISEAPLMKKATVNIGDRQKGRIKASSIIDSTENLANIFASITKALSLDFQAELKTVQSLYGHGDVSKKIKNTLKVIEPVLKKSFFDIKHES